MMAVERVAVESPCVKRCRVDPDTGRCEGCLRSIAEIANWTRMSNERRRRVLKRIAAAAPAATET